MSFVNVKNRPTLCRPVEFKKRLCHPVDFRGLDPYGKHNFQKELFSVHRYCLLDSKSRRLLFDVK